MRSHRSLYHYVSVLTFVGGSLNAGCMWSSFDDLKTQAPVLKLEQSGEKSGNFGNPFAAIPFHTETSEKVKEGTIIVAAGTGEKIALSTATFEADGSFAIPQTSTDDLGDSSKLASPDAIMNIAEAPFFGAYQGLYPGPYAYVATRIGTVGRILVLDVQTYKQINSGPILANADGNIGNFGIGLKWADFDGDGERDDLVAGATGRVTLVPSTGWPEFEKDKQRHIQSAKGQRDWPETKDFSIVETGDLDGDGKDEAVVAAPDVNFVAVIFDIQQCIENSSQACRAINLPPFETANEWGAAVLIADVTGDRQNDLVIGAPSTKTGASGAGNGAIYVYEVTATSLQDETLASATPIVIPAPAEAIGFGKTLAYGHFGGKTDGLLAVGAPSTVVNGFSGAGAIYVYPALKEDSGVCVPNVENRLDPNAKCWVATLTKPQEGMVLATKLVTVPFKANGTVTEILAATGSNAIYVFFGGLAPGYVNPKISAND